MCVRLCVKCDCLLLLLTRCAVSLHALQQVQAAPALAVQRVCWAVRFTHWSRASHSNPCHTRGVFHTENNVRAEFHGERIVEMHMQRLGGKEQLLAQVYSAFATRRDDTVELALRAYGAPARRPVKTCLQACQCVQKELFGQR